MTSARPVRVFGDRAVVVDLDTVDDAHRLAAAIAAAGRSDIEDVIVGYRSVTVVAEATVTDIAGWADDLAAAPVPAPGRTAPQVVEIPVAFDGPDLDDVARLARMSPSGIVDRLTDTELQVAFVGFAPGFAYLVGLPGELASVPRRPTPRPAVPGGSVAVAGGFAAVYPRASPGGWHLIGRTGLALFDPDTPPYSVLRAGDVVRFRPGDVPDRFPGVTPVRPLLRSAADRQVVVEDAGLLSLVQDRGRLGVAGLGVPRAGAADPDCWRVANRLVGNDDQSAAVEVTGRGPTLRFSAPAHVAVVGASEVKVDGHAVPGDSVVPVGPGQTLRVGMTGPGLRAYIAVAGGIDIPSFFGSRSSDVLSRLGVGPLVTGDVLGLGPPGHPRGRARPAAAPDPAPALRVMVGPDLFPAATVQGLLSTTWEVDPASDRIGLRLDAPAPLDAAAVNIASRGMITGAIQLPPDGRPIILLCDHATVGGYPVIATVASADLGALGQLRPGDPVRFAPVDLAEAMAARARHEQHIDDAVVGWYPVRTD